MKERSKERSEERSLDESLVAGPSASDRRLKYAVIAYAVVEFVALVLVVYYKAAR